MADNITTTTSVATLPAGTVIATRAVTYSGDANALVAPVGLVAFSGSDDAKVATDIGHLEDSAHTSGAAGIMALTVRQDTAAALAGTDADYQPLITDANGRLHVVATAAQSSNIVDDAAFTPASSNVSMVGFTADEASTDSVDEGDGGAARMTLDRKQIVTTQPHTSGGLSVFRSLDIDETEEDVKVTPGNLYGVWFTNTSTATMWLKFFDGIASGIAVGTDTPVITVGLPGSTDDVTGNIGMQGLGHSFSSGICVACTTGVLDTSTTGPAANEVVINVFYK